MIAASRVAVFAGGKFKSFWPLTKSEKGSRRAMLDGCGLLHAATKYTSSMAI
jgi:hypothetical protein